MGRSSKVCADTKQKRIQDRNVAGLAAALLGTKECCISGLSVQEKKYNK